MAPRAHNLIYGVIFLLAISAAAVVAYMLNGWSFNDAFLMTVVTVFTVGYDGIRPLDTIMLCAITITLILLGRQSLDHRGTIARRKTIGVGRGFNCDFCALSPALP